MDDLLIIQEVPNNGYFLKGKLQTLDTQIDETTDVIAFNNTGLDV